jgi:hypothetical protein
MGCISSQLDKTAPPSTGLSLNASKYAYVDAVMNKYRQIGGTSSSHDSSSAFIRAKTGVLEEESSADMNTGFPISSATVKPSKLRNDVKLSDIYKLGKTIGTGGETLTCHVMQLVIGL